MANSVELFSGAGGLAKGLEQAGAKHLTFIECNHDACRTLRANYDPSIVFEGDIRNFSFSHLHNIDIVAGGPPCQPFSLGGLAKGMNDGRDMFPHAVRAIRELMPKAFVFENVKGLLRSSFSKYFEFIILQLSNPQVILPYEQWEKNFEFLKKVKPHKQRIGYNVSYKLVNVADYGVPQKRERVIIVGIRSDLDVNWEFPQPSHSKDALLWDKFVSGKYWERHHIAPITNYEIKHKLESIYGLFPPTEKPWLTVRDAFQGLKCNGKGTDSIAKEYVGHTGSDIDEPSKTIKAGSHGVPGGENMVKYSDGTIKYYTLEEAKRIQTFPDDYIITGSWTEGMRQLGNAVPVKIGYVFGKSLIPKIENL